MPPFQVAQAMDQAIKNFMATNPTVLKRISVVIYEKRMLSDFVNAITESPSSSIASQPMPLSLNGVNVNVIGGDVLTSNCDVLINTTSDSFDLSGKYLKIRSDYVLSNNLFSKYTVHENFCF